MPFELDNHYILPKELRSELSSPLGELISGDIDETTPLLREKLLPKKGKIVGVGDVTAEILVNHEFLPDIIVTDGKTKREELDTWVKYPNFYEISATCPPAEITSDALYAIRRAVELSDDKQVHILIDGEEDLLVLPLIIELPTGSSIVYGQPNTGAVIRKVDDESKQFANDFLERMDKQ